MGKFETPFEDTLETFKNLISVAELDRYINIDIVSDNNMKKIYSVSKTNEYTKFKVGVDATIFLNELIFEQLNDLHRTIVAEEAIAALYFNTEKDKLEVKTPDVKTFSGILAKYKDHYESLQESIRTLYEMEKNKK
tara:strand:+ start:5253 stop:5660 length:408 start_codon:yes stop_codon:yes gene_type:complete